jgi:hypothetical protein
MMVSELIAVAVMLLLLALIAYSTSLTTTLLLVCVQLYQATLSQDGKSEWLSSFVTA